MTDDNTTNDRLLREDDPLFVKLTGRLKEFGIVHVDRSPNSDLGIVLERGELFLTDSMRRVRSRAVGSSRRRCHENVALRYMSDPHNAKIVTGYALHSSELDSAWMCHSWLWDGTTVLETTPVCWDLYFGAILNDYEAAQFSMFETIKQLPGWQAYIEGIRDRRTNRGE